MYYPWTEGQMGILWQTEWKMRTNKLYASLELLVTGSKTCCTESCVAGMDRTWENYSLWGEGNQGSNSKMLCLWGRQWNPWAKSSAWENYNLKMYLKAITKNTVLSNRRLGASCLPSFLPITTTILGLWMLCFSSSFLFQVRNVGARWEWSCLHSGAFPHCHLQAQMLKGAGGNTLPIPEGVL